MAFRIHKQALGDITCASGVLRDLQAMRPELAIEVRGWCAELFRGHPQILWNNRAPANHKRGWDDDEIPLAIYLNEYRDGSTHLQEMFRARISKSTRVDITTTKIGGDLYLTDEEKAPPLPWGDEPYWILNAGSKTSTDSLTVKQPDVSELQKVVAHFKGKLLFVQTGSKFHNHPRLNGAFDYIETHREATFRKAMVAMYRANGTLTPISWPMHLAAALELPTPIKRAGVVLAGGRENPQLIQYDNHQVISAIGQLDCCPVACWKNRTGEDCTNASGNLAKCMTFMTAPKIIAAIELAESNRASKELTTKAA